MYVNSGMGALNCPGDPGCPGYVDPNAVNLLDLYPIGAALENPSPYGSAPGGTGGGGTAPVVGGGTFTSWLNANGTTLALAGAGLFGVVLLGRMAR